MSNSYTVEYPNPDDFCKSGPCGTGKCLGVLYYNPRPQHFCEDIVIQKNCTLFGNMVVKGNMFVETRLEVAPKEITVGGLVYKEKLIVIDEAGSFYNILATDITIVEPPPS